jgi:hypothetical protein
MADLGKINYSVQQAVNPGNTPEAYGAASLYGVRGVHSNVDNSFKCTFYNGTQVKLAFLTGITYPYAIRSMSASTGSAISSTSAYVIAIR